MIDICRFFAFFFAICHAFWWFSCCGPVLGFPVMLQASAANMWRVKTGLESNGKLERSGNQKSLPSCVFVTPRRVFFCRKGHVLLKLVTLVLPTLALLQSSSMPLSLLAREEMVGCGPKRRHASPLFICRSAVSAPSFWGHTK